MSVQLREISQVTNREEAQQAFSAEVSIRDSERMTNKVQAPVKGSHERVGTETQERIKNKDPIGILSGVNLGD